MRESKRNKLLVAANDVVLRCGASAMTLDTVAAQAGVSKGGLLYHFATKEALIEAMVSALVEKFEATLQEEMARDDGPQRGRFLRAYVRVGTTPEDDFDAVISSVLAAVAANPKLLSALREADARWQERAENDGLSPQSATMVRLATDGFWLSGLFGLDAGLKSDAQWRAVQKALLAFIENAAQEVPL